MSKKPTERQDVRTLWLGIVLSLLITVLIWALDPLLADIELLPDQGMAWYYWKLPEPTFMTRFSAWGFYALHQIAFWWLIWTAQKNKTKYSTGLHRVNFLALGVNAVFILLRVLQTHIWYDGLAQDVSIFSSQGSVIVLLVWVLLMENKRRGLIAGKKAPISAEINRFAAQVSRLLFRLGDSLHFLVPSGRQYPRSSVGLFLHVPAPLAGQPLFHPHPHQQVLDLCPGIHRSGPWDHRGGLSGAICGRCSPLALAPSLS